MSKHTPTPWKSCEGGTQGKKCSCGQVWSIPGDFPVCTATELGCVVHQHMADAPNVIYQSIAAETRIANADLIVTAVNSYDSLRSINKELVEALENLLRNSGISDVPDQDKFPEDIEGELAARAVLARAKSLTEAKP